MPLLQAENRLNHKEAKLISSLTHDLRAPLCAIMGYLDLASRQVGDAAPPKAVEYMSLAREASERLARMVNDLLDFLQKDAAESVPVKRFVRVADLFCVVRKTFMVTAALKNVRLSFELPDGDGLHVSGNPDQLSRVLDNLVGNAIKFTASGGMIEVAARNEAHRTVFEITDTGRGISPKARRRVFRPFQQARRTDQSGGFGLGLAIAKAIVEAHGGRIRLESTLGRGSRFIFWIPSVPSPVL